jgi:hypothetical protein
MRSPVVPRSFRPVSRNAPGVCGTGSATSEFVLPPIAAPDVDDRASHSGSPRHAGGHAECSGTSSLSARPASRHSPCLHTDAERRFSGDEPPGQRASAQAASHHAVGHRSRLGTAGFHDRRRAGCVWSPFFPRSVGFRPTASRARGALTIAPSILCHDQAIPSISSYTAKPRRHSFTNTPTRFHSRKYACTELALPYSLGNAFHWQPVRSTYTIASNTRRGSIRFRPAPGWRRYLRPLARCASVSAARHVPTTPQTRSTT